MSLCEEKEINVKEYVDTYVGRYTLSLIERDIKEELYKGNGNIVVNVEGLSINDDYTLLLAGLINEYGCEFRGIGNKEDVINSIISTGSFVKRDMGIEKYVKWFKRMVEKADYPLMIRDNRLKSKRTVEMNVIQPLIFDGKYFHFNVIKPKYLEPVYLEEAIKKGYDIYTRETINEIDLANMREGFRFVKDRNERYIIDVFKSIISGENWGFIN